MNPFSLQYCIHFFASSPLNGFNSFMDSLSACAFDVENSIFPAPATAALKKSSSFIPGCGILAAVYGTT
jgi:hypothetical protein